MDHALSNQPQAIQKVAGAVKLIQRADIPKQSWMTPRHLHEDRKVILVQPSARGAAMGGNDGYPALERPLECPWIG
jgi:hypothetical protein